MKMSLRPYATVGVALVGAAVFVVSPLSPPSQHFQRHAVHLTGDTVGLVIGGSGTPIPGASYVEAANDLYIQASDPGTIYPGVLAKGLFTPEGLYPLDGTNVLRLNYPAGSDGFPAQTTSVGQGMTILDDNIKAQLADGNAVTVFGYSQSSTIASLEMEQLDPSGTPSKLPISFVLIGDPSNPNGGLLERFNGFESSTGSSYSLPLNIPSMGMAFDGATPADDFHTSIYTIEYDGFADFPRYPIDFLADLNAFLGIDKLHGTYLNGGADGNGPTPEQIKDATLLPGSEDSKVDPCHSCLTNYYMIDETAPLVSLLPKSMQELLGPDLTYLINLGYGADNLGYSDTSASTPTPFGLFPDVSMGTIMKNLVADTELGWKDYSSGTDPYASSGSAADAPNSVVTTISDTLNGASTTGAPTFTSIVDALSGAVSATNGGLAGLSDISNALSTSLPAYELDLFTTNLEHGNLLDAFFMPMAAGTALDTLADGFELEIVMNTLSGVEASFTDAGL